MLRAFITNNKLKTSKAKADQAMFCWGNVTDGQLGLGGIEEEQIFTPRELVAFRSQHVANLSCGVAHTLFVMKDGVVYSCGNNDYGQLGHEKTRRKPGLKCGFLSHICEHEEVYEKRHKKPGVIICARGCYSHINFEQLI